MKTSLHGKKEKADVEYGQNGDVLPSEAFTASSTLTVKECQPEPRKAITGSTQLQIKGSWGCLISVVMSSNGKWRSLGCTKTLIGQGLGC